jgi:hypothetical protein
MNGLILNIVSSLIVGALGLLVGVLIEHVRRARQLGHLRLLLAKAERVQIVAPYVNPATYVRHVDHKPSPLPKNNPFMPMHESAAIARLVLAIRNARPKCSVNISGHDAYRDDYDVTFCIGGPLVNPTTGLFIPSSFPQLSNPSSIKRGAIDTLAFNDHIYAPSYDKKGEITGDYGFIFLVPEYGHTHILIFGNWSPGTEIAAKYLVSPEARIILSHLIARRIKAMVVVHGEVRGLSNGSLHLVDVHTIV